MNLSAKAEKWSSESCDKFRFLDFSHVKWPLPCILSKPCLQFFVRFFWTFYGMLRFILIVLRDHVGFFAERRFP